MGTFERDVFMRVRVLFLHFLDFNRRSEGMIRKALDLAQQCRVRVVADTDDAYFMPADHGPFDAALQPHLPVMRELAGCADLITVTCDRLAEEMAFLGRPRRVIPNWVDRDEYQPRECQGSRLRVGFAGGPTHLLDLAAILPAIADVQRIRDFELVLFGLYDRDMHATVARVRTLTARQAADPRIADFATFAKALSGVRFTHQPSVPQADFPRVLSQLDLDIGMCPLLDTPFNRCRSGVKFYQYAAVGTTTLASDVAPYRGECHLLCDHNRGSWRAALTRLIDDAEWREAALQTQQGYWRKHRTWSAVSPRYEGALLGRAVTDGDGDWAA